MITTRNRYQHARNMYTQSAGSTPNRNPRQRIRASLYRRARYWAKKISGKVARNTTEKVVFGIRLNPA